jgi:prepilin signal peptidase PulO-like enzyme (type II secretory pathway)
VTGEAHRSPATRFSRAAIGERLAGFIYGTIVALAVIVAGARAYPHEAGYVAALVAATTVALWIAHVYAHGLGHSVAQDEHLSRAELQRIARREGSIVEAAVPPVAMLLLGALGLVSTHAAIWAAFGIGLLVLAAEGIAFARVERLGWLGTLAVVAGNLSLGVLIVGVKLLVTH